MEVVWLTSAEAYEEHASALGDLFQRCFGRPINEPLWNRCYRENLVGPPVSLAVRQDGAFVAHHGSVPQSWIQNGEQFDCRLLMSLMVDPAARSTGAFTFLEQNYMPGLREHGGDNLLAFPNQQSFALHVGLLGWKRLDADVFVTTPVVSGSHLPEECALADVPRSLEAANIAFWEWRAWAEFHGFRTAAGGGFSLKVDSPTSVVLMECFGAVTAAEVASAAAMYGATEIKGLKESFLSAGFEAETLTETGYQVRKCGIGDLDGLRGLGLSLYLGDVF
jgi:hypothetical protein